MPNSLSSLSLSLSLFLSRSTTKYDPLQQDLKDILERERRGRAQKNRNWQGKILRKNHLWNVWNVMETWTGCDSAHMPRGPFGRRRRIRIESTGSDPATGNPTSITSTRRWLRCGRPLRTRQRRSNRRPIVSTADSRAGTCLRHCRRRRPDATIWWRRPGASATLLPPPWWFNLYFSLSSRVFGLVNWPFRLFDWPVVGLNW